MKRMVTLGLWMVLLMVLEARRPLRRQRDSKLLRYGVNGSVGMLGAAVLSLTELPATRLSAHAVLRYDLGLLPKLRLPGWLEGILAFVILDYSIYLWHVLLHRVPLLWRFHVAHHTDRDLDSTTALRFHFGELLFSMFWRAATIFFFGIKPKQLSLWETFLIAEITFHHSNIRLGRAIERRLCYFIVTPRMHGIHHSIIETETNSNWSSGLSIWDRLHGTFKSNVPQEDILIGVPAYRLKSEVGLPATLLLPFRAQRYSWAFADGMRPLRLLHESA